MKNGIEHRGVSRALRTSLLAGSLIGMGVLGASMAIGDDTDTGVIRDLGGPADGGQAGDNVGACCYEDGTCDVVTALDCAFTEGFFRGSSLLCTPGALGGEGMYLLKNHPDGNAAPPQFGLRLDELFDLHPGEEDIFTFDFEAEDSEMYLTYIGDQIVIQGKAYGGLVENGAYVPEWSSVVEIYFEYNLVEGVPGDDDLMVPPPQFQNSGWIKWLETGEVIGLWDTAGSHPFSFRFGDMDDELGHRGYDGISGYGWLNHGVPDFHHYSSDWLFVATDVCLSKVIAGACCVSGTCVDTTFAECIGLGGVYQGDNTTCDGGVTCTIFGPGDCREDFNADGRVDIDDLLAILGDWGSCPKEACPCDLNRDETVDVNDLLRVVSAWGECD